MKANIAILDDYQQVALKNADWSKIMLVADVTVFMDHLHEETALARRLQPFVIICVMRERTPLTRSLLQQLPNLKLIVSTGMRNSSIDTVAAEELGIAIRHTRYITTGAPEMSWALLLALAKNITTENRNFRDGGWQTTIATDLSGKTLGLIGLGRVGAKVARYARAFGMNVIAWSQNLTAERAEQEGATLVTKKELFEQADFISMHLVLSERTKGIVQKNDLELMKAGAFFINTSRGPLVDEQALLGILREKKIAGAALDVYQTEPLPADHPFRSLDNLLATPHTGYVTEETYRVFYTDTVMAVEEWLAVN